MKRLFIFLLLITACLCPFAISGQKCFAATESKTYVVTANVATVYSAPDLSAEKLSTLSHKNELEVEFEDGLVKEYLGSGFVFFHTTNLEQDGYVICDLVVPKQKYLQTIPEFNAKTNAKAKVYFLVDGKYVASEITLSKHQRIFLYQGFNRKKEFNAVAFVYENEVVYGFLKESAIDPDGINPIIISVACVAMAAIGIILALVFMKRKKIKTDIPKVKKR